MSNIGYLLHSKYSKQSISFPVDKFQYNTLAYDRETKRTPKVDVNYFKHLIQPYPTLRFDDGQFVVPKKPTVDCPWKIEDIRETVAYKDGWIWEVGEEQIDQTRRETGEVSCILPDGFDYEELKACEKLKKLAVPFEGKKTEDGTVKAPTQKALEGQNEFLKEIIKTYRFVNIPLSTKPNVKKLEACRELMLDELKTAVAAAKEASE
jgi:hypothetical protein